MEPATPKSINDIPMLQTLGIRLVEIGETHAVMEVRVSEMHRNYFGGAHGGLIATLADTVCFFARPLLPSGRKVTTVNLNLHYVRAAALGDLLRARSEILHLGRRTVSLAVRIENDSSELIAHGSATLLVLEEPPGRGDVSPDSRGVVH